ERFTTNENGPEVWRFDPPFRGVKPPNIRSRRRDVSSALYDAETGRATDRRRRASRPRGSADQRLVALSGNRQSRSKRARYSAGHGSAGRRRLALCHCSTAALPWRPSSDEENLTLRWIHASATPSFMRRAKSPHGSPSAG